MSLYTKIMQWAVPVAAGWLLTLALQAGVDLDSDMVTTAVQAGLTVSYALLLDALEEWADRIGLAWLRTLAQGALGRLRPTQESDSS